VKFHRVSYLFNTWLIALMQSRELQSMLKKPGEKLNSLKVLQDV